MTDLALPLQSNMEALAGVLTNIGRVMLGLSFRAAGESAEPKNIWRTATLPIPGRRPLLVALSSDEAGCLALCSRMYGCAPSAVDAMMINDCMCELVNMTAGGIKTVLALDQALGLPKIVDTNLLKDLTGAVHILMRAPGIDVVLSLIASDRKP
jgi:hypothetical protein